MKKLGIWLGLILILFSSLASAKQDPYEALRELPVQDGGRVKPYDTFARETLQLVYGRESYKNKNGKKFDAIEIVFTWFLPEVWDKEQFIRVGHQGLKTALKLPLKQQFFSPLELFGNERLGIVISELQAKRQTKEKLNPYFQAVQTLESQLGVYHAIRNGKAPRFVPPKTGDTWLSIEEMGAPLQEKFQAIATQFVRVTQDREGADMTAEVAAFAALAKAENPALYGDPAKIKLEVHYEHFHPFRVAWILYLLGVLLMVFSSIVARGWLYKLSWVTSLLALGVHIYGFGLRVYLTGRAPVSNMYESVVWVAFGAIIFGMIFEAIYRKKFVMVAAGIISVFSMIVADSAPAILDQTLQPLEPVLRSNYWLVVHVLTITLSYSAFFLAFGLGNFGMIYFIKGESKYVSQIFEINKVIYRSVQVGIVLLAAGIILGGIWADESWGRFWGWDPKETWALIALLGYLAILHGRLVGILRQFGMMAGVVISFNLVIMAWYGVNYVLGAGLHSYGFGAGGIEYVSAFVAANLLFVALAGGIHWNRLRT